MKRFQIQGTLLRYPPKEFTEDQPPKWLLSTEYRWFYRQHVLTLGVGRSVETDFSRITRLEDVDG